MARRKAQAAMEKDRNISDEREREQNPLRPDQMTPGGAQRKSRCAPMTATRRRPPVSAVNCCRLNSVTKTTCSATMFGGKKDESAKFTGEPPRTSLTDPPPGYQTPSPDQPYGIGKGGNAEGDRLLHHTFRAGEVIVTAVDLALLAWRATSS